MVDMSRYFGSEKTGTVYVSGAELYAKFGTKKVPAIITSVDVKEFDEIDRETGKTKRIPKSLLELSSRDGKEWPKKACLTPAKSRLLMETFGTDGDHWIGRQIKLWGKPGKMNGSPIVELCVEAVDMTEAEAEAPKPAPTPRAAPPMDWSPPSEPADRIIDDDIPF